MRDSLCVVAAGICRQNAAGIRHRKCGWDSPLEVWFGFAIGNAVGIRRQNDDGDGPLQGLVKRDQVGKPPPRIS